MAPRTRLAALLLPPGLLLAVGAPSVTHPGPGVGIDVCKLLTPAQVATILPGHDGGEVMHNGGSLIKGVDAYQCSYTSPEVHIFTVVVNVAVDDKRFAQIKPHFMAGEATKVPVGAGGWLRGEGDDLKLTAVKERAVLDLELLTPDAGKRSAALVALGQAALARL